MEEVKNAVFSFESFKVPKFTYKEDNHQGTELKLGFIPKGEYNPRNGEYKLILELISHDSENKNNIVFGLTAIATFKFTPLISFDKIPSYFYKNVIAIMFPYVRAFVSTLTLQANTKLLKLDLMNLTSLEQPLITNTTEI